MNAALVEWVSEPDGRGTASILGSCLFTIFLSTWTAYHPDVETRWLAAIWDKVLITIAAIFAPELIICLAIVDWNRVKKLQFIFRKIHVEVRQLSLPTLLSHSKNAAQPFTECAYPDPDQSFFSRLVTKTNSIETEKSAPRSTSTSYDDDNIAISPTRPLSVTHAHFLRMGGFSVRSCDGEIFPARHAWSKNRISVQSVSILRAATVSITSVPIVDIEDKNKSDGISKIFALCQIFWLFVHLIARAAAHVPISTLELFTASNAACAVISYYFWWSKPKGEARNILA